MAASGKFALNSCRKGVAISVSPMPAREMTNIFMQKPPPFNPGVPAEAANALKNGDQAWETTGQRNDSRSDLFLD
jgi:hypothetical protein